MGKIEVSFEQFLSIAFGMSIIPSRAQEMFIKGVVENSPAEVFHALCSRVHNKKYELVIIEHIDDKDFNVVYGRNNPNAIIIDDVIEEDNS